MIFHDFYFFTKESVEFFPLIKNELFFSSSDRFIFIALDIF